MITSTHCGGEIHLAITGAFVRVERKMHKICSSLECTLAKEENMGRAILLWLLGVPIPIIILLALFWH
jgi:hypothetical protein